MTQHDLKDDQQLLERYVQICNTAIREGATDQPLRGVMDATLRDRAGTEVEVEIIDDTPNYRIPIILDEETKVLCLAEPIDMCCEDSAQCQCSRAPVWRVRRSYLEQVARHPETYINDPALIDWEWLFNSAENQANLVATMSLQGNSVEHAAHE